MDKDWDKIMADRERARMPSYIQSLPKRDAGTLPKNAAIQFTWKLLHNIFGGGGAADGFFVITEEKRKDKHDDDPFKTLTGYRVIDYSHNPLMALEPGQHCAQITAVTSESAQDKVHKYNFPVFVGIGQNWSDEYKYIGHFCHPSPEDTLSYNEMYDLPMSVKEHWAGYLQQTSKDDCFRAIERLYNLKGAEKTRARLEKLTKDQLLEAMDSHWGGAQPSLTLCYSYYEFLRFDKKFFEKLVNYAKTIDYEGITSQEYDLEEALEIEPKDNVTQHEKAQNIGNETASSLKPSSLSESSDGKIVLDTKDANKSPHDTVFRPNNDSIVERDPLSPNPPTRNAGSDISTLTKNSADESIQKAELGAGCLFEASDKKGAQNSVILETDGPNTDSIATANPNNSTPVQSDTDPSNFDNTNTRKVWGPMAERMLWEIRNKDKPKPAVEQGPVVPFTIQSLQLRRTLRQAEFCWSKPFAIPPYGDSAHYILCERAYRVGEVADAPCDFCEGVGCFKECVIVCEGKWEGACVNCFLRDRVKYCTHWEKKQQAERRKNQRNRRKQRQPNSDSRPKHTQGNGNNQNNEGGENGDTDKPRLNQRRRGIQNREKDHEHGPKRLKKNHNSGPRSK